MEKVILYSTGCPRCGVLESKLKAAGIEFEKECSVDAMLALGVTEVPTLRVGDKLLGFMDAVQWANRR